jgi:HlyD family secretion protein
MTANATIEIARRDDVLRVPAAALRFKPDAAVLAQYTGGASSPAAMGKTVWVMNGSAIAPVPVKAGASDGTYTEIAGDALAEGALVVTRAASASVSTTPASTSSNNPLLPSRPNRAPGR